jgi:cytochrome c-type biogenesis protein CcmH/NrfG
MTAVNEGGAVIADRFKLDMPDPSAQKQKGGKLAAVSLVVALLAMAVAGVLAFVMYQHWEFLKGA